MGAANGRRTLNTGPYSPARSAKRAGTLPLRTCGLNSRWRSETAGIFLVSTERRSRGPARFSTTAAAMDRPIRSIRQMSAIRSSAALSSWNMKRRTSHVLARQITMTSLGSGISSVKMTLPIRVLMNWRAVPPSGLPCSSSCQTVRASVQKSPS